MAMLMPVTGSAGIDPILTRVDKTGKMRGNYRVIRARSEYIYGPETYDISGAMINAEFGWSTRSCPTNLPTADGGQDLEAEEGRYDG